MLTVKLYRGQVSKLIEATEINIYPCGREKGSDQNPKLRTAKVREIEVETYTGKHLAFYIADDLNPESHGLAPEVEMWNGAYIENAHGATTETVRPY